MTNSWNGPKLGSPIRTDVPELQKKLIALLKQDPTSVANIPSGAKRLVNTSGVQWQVQQYNGSSWAAIGKLMHDVDKLDGYHAAITPAASTIAVRNADKKLEGDITGNAATASSATTLSETLPVNKGGTGATTSAAARTNLGVPPTSHASSGTTYGLGSNLNYGHVRGDGVTTNVVAGEVVAKDVAIRGDSADLASARGQIGNRVSLSGIDYNSLVKFGHYVVEGKGSTNTPTGTETTFYVDVFETKYSATTRILQIAYRSGNAQQYVRSSLDSGETWSQWEKSIYVTDYATASTPGIVKPGTGMTVGAAGELNVNTASTSKAGIVQLNNTVKSTSTTQAATAKAVKTAYDKAVNALPVGALHASFASSISGCLLCNGAAVSRTTYAALFAILDTKFGKGDGSETFNLPDFRNKTLWGANKNLMSVLTAGLPNVTGKIDIASGGDSGWDCKHYEKALYPDSRYQSAWMAPEGSGSMWHSMRMDLSRGNAIYGNADTVQPPAIAVNFFIKY